MIIFQFEICCFEFSFELPGNCFNESDHANTFAWFRWCLRWFHEKYFELLLAKSHVHVHSSRFSNNFENIHTLHVTSAFKNMFAYAYLMIYHQKYRIIWTGRRLQAQTMNISHSKQISVTSGNTQYGFAANIRFS